MLRNDFVHRFHQLAVLLVALGLAACAADDSLFGDAQSAHSGRYEQELATKRAAVAHEQARNVALSQQQQALQTRTRQLNQQIVQQRRSVNNLQATVAVLNTQVQQAQSATAAAEAKKVHLHTELEKLKQEVAALQNNLAGDPSTAELQALKKQEQELRQAYSDLLAIYRTM